MEKSIKLIEFGRTDGKKESVSVPNFEDMFYDGDGFYEKLKNPEIFMVIGRKGMGKTILASYFSVQMKKKPNSVVEMFNASDLLETKLEILDYNEISDQELRIFWDYVLLKKIANLIIESAKRSNSKKVFRISAKQVKNLEILASSKNFSPVAVETNSKVKSNAGLSEKGMQASVGTENGQSTKYIKQYYQSIDPLRRAVFDVLKKPGRTYYLIIDDLDELASRGFYGNYVKPIHSLLESVRLLNEHFQVSGITTKIIVTLREDMNELIQENSDNWAKYVDDSAIKLKWFAAKGTNPWDMDITKMVLKKIGISLNRRDANGKDLLSEFFNLNYIKKTQGYKSPQISFILERTFGRPRDFIQFLKKYISLFPDDTKFYSQKFQTVFSEYANDFMSEIKNELHIDNDRMLIQAILDDINNLGWKEFTLQDLLGEKNEQVDLENWKVAFQKLYKVGLVGIVRNGESKYQFSYRDGSPKKIRLDEHSTQVYRAHFVLTEMFSLVKPPVM